MSEQRWRGLTVSFFLASLCMTDSLQDDVRRSRSVVASRRLAFVHGLSPADSPHPAQVRLPMPLPRARANRETDVTPCSSCRGAGGSRRAEGRTLPHCYVEIKDRETAMLVLTRCDRTSLGHRTVRVRMERVGELMRDVSLLLTVEFSLLDPDQAHAFHSRVCCFLPAFRSECILSSG